MIIFEFQTLEARYLWLLRYARLQLTGHSDGGAYTSQTTPVAGGRTSATRTPLTASLSRKLAVYSLNIWGEAILAREQDGPVKADPTGNGTAFSNIRGEREFVVPATLAMYTRVGVPEFRPGDDPPEAAFHVLQVERMLIGFAPPVKPLVMTEDERKLIEGLRSGATYQGLAKREKVPASLMKKWTVDLSRKIRLHQQKTTRTETPPVERLYCVHRFVHGYATQKFADGLRVDRRIIDALSTQLRDTWGASIPIAAVRQASDYMMLKRRESQAKADAQQREKKREQTIVEVPGRVLGMTESENAIKFLTDLLGKEEQDHNSYASVNNDRDLRFVGAETSRRKGNR